MAKPDFLTAQQEAFAVEYVKNGCNASAAYRAAYPASLKWKQKTVWETSSKLLTNPKVRTRVKQLQEALATESELSLKKWAEEVSRLALFDPRELFKEDGSLKLPHELDANTAAAVASFEFDITGQIKYKFWPKTAALEMAAKHIGAFERDNKQKVDGLTALLGTLGGNVKGVSNEEGEE